MAQKMGAVSALFVGVVVYLIWKDPSGTAGVFQGFFSAVGHFLGDLWNKLGEFFGAF